MNNTTRCMGIISGLCLMLVGSAQAEDRYVWQGAENPTPPYTNGWDKAANNIQDAVNAANDGDTIRVRPGTYTASENPSNYPAGTNPNVVFINKPLILRSESGNPEDTIIDGENVNRCLAWNYSSAIGPFVLDGFTLANGLANEMGGGILLAGNARTRTIRNCLIRDSMVTIATNQNLGGGGLFASSGGTVLSNCTFRGNMVSNTASFDGGGGGAFLSGGGQIDNCLFESNSAYNGSGGGLLLNRLGSTEIRNTRIVSNTMWQKNGSATHGGGGVENMYSAKLYMWNCLIADNQANLYGKAIYNMKGGTLELYNCTVSGNSGSGYAAVQTRLSSDNLVMVNSIVYDNTPQDFVIMGTDSRLDYSCFPTNELNTQVFLGAGNITNAPGFVNAAAGNYHLSSSSPCLNAGTNQLDWMVGALDLDGNPRIDRSVGTVDMGCYETVYSGSLITIR